MIVLAGGRFRVNKREHKTRGMQGDKKPDDVDVQGAVLAERYPLLSSLLGELVEGGFCPFGILFIGRGAKVSANKHSVSP